MVIAFDDNFFVDDREEDPRDDGGDVVVVPKDDDATSVIDKEFIKFYQELQPFQVTASYKKYTFKPFYHPFVCTMIKQLNRYGLDGLLDPKSDTEAGSILLRQQGTEVPFSFENTYLPNTTAVSSPYPEEGFDFDHDGPYGNYNWELFFHGPLLIANKLTQNQKFEEAQKWLHYIFNPTEVADPTDTESNVIPAPARYWKVKPFFENARESVSVGGNELEAIDAILEKMASGDKAFNRQLDQWMKSPFQPHIIARLRVVSYMKSVVMKYLDNLIQWGDSLFMMDTIESINEATQLYILASQILGPKPVAIDKQDTTVKTVEEMMSANSGLVDVESEIGSIDTDQEVDLGSGLNSLNSIMYFCTSPNDKLLAYWDTVTDRLYKIRNCQNIDGVERSLSLFEPPIDPALLVKASAAGLDIASVLSGISGTNMPYYRFNVLVQKAIELCNDVKGLGQSLLSALEKKDAEELSLLRANQEVSLLNAVKQIREKAIEESQETLSSLENARELSEIRRQFYDSRQFMNAQEQKQLKKMEEAMVLQVTSQMAGALASKLANIPDVAIGAAGIASPYFTATVGGSTFRNIFQGHSAVLSALSSIENFRASKAGIKGGYERRKDDWALQADLAEKELEQIAKQITAAEIRVAMNERELENHNMQIEQSTEVADFMKNKYTSRDLYNWMITQVSGIYFQSYQLAFDVARMAERAFGYELAVDSPSFIKFGHWDSLKKGLLSGERLQADLRRMEVAYLEQNKREYELTKHISLSMLSPAQLVDLRENGSCDIQIPEVLFDLDHPGQYLRRIKSVSLTIPCVTGAYTNVNAKLTLLSNRYRKNTTLDAGYSITGDADSRFTKNVAGIQSIATSSAQNDAGVFELNFQDARYLPFERAGAISTWRLELSSTFRQFDYDTISDVILHMNYTAREGGQTFRSAVESDIKANIENWRADLASTSANLQRLFSLKTHFPNALYQLLQPVDDPNPQTCSFEIKKEHFPHFFAGSDIKLGAKVKLLLKLRDSSLVTPSEITLDLKRLSTSVGRGALTGADTSDPILEPLPYLNLSTSSSENIIDSWSIEATSTSPASDLETKLNSTEVEDVYLLFDYTITTN